MITNYEVKCEYGISPFRIIGSQAYSSLDCLCNLLGLSRSMMTVPNDYKYVDLDEFNIANCYSFCLTLQ